MITAVTILSVVISVFIILGVVLYSSRGKRDRDE